MVFKGSDLTVEWFVNENGYKTSLSFFLSRISKFGRLGCISVALYAI